LDKYFLVKNALILCFFILGAMLIFIEIPGLHGVVLLLDAIILAFLIFDLDAPKRIGGMGTIPVLRIFLAGLGGIVLLLYPTGIARARANGREKRCGLKL